MVSMLVTNSTFMIESTLRSNNPSPSASCRALLVDSSVSSEWWARSGLRCGRQRYQPWLAVGEARLRAVSTMSEARLWSMAETVIVLRSSSKTIDVILTALGSARR
jgi:hypothetical protein